MAVEEKIWEAANRHGSGEEILKVIAAGETLEAVIRQVMDQKKIHDELAIEITKRDTSLKDLVAKTASYQGHIEVAKTLFKSGFDLNACNELITAAGKYGSAPGVIGAVNDYNSLTDLNSVVRARKEEIAAMGDSIKKLQGEYTALMKQNAEAYQLLGQIDEKYRRSMYLQHVASIIDNPRGARIPLPELARISVAFMNGFMICAEASPDQNRKLIDAVRGYVDHLITSLNGFLRGV